jgi:hypothetical protein
MSSRRLAVVGAVLLAACGSQSESQPGPEGPDGPAGGAVPLAELLAGTSYVKVVLKTTEVVRTPVTVYDGGTDTFSNIPCTADAQCTAVQAGTSCYGGLCVSTSYADTVFYARNLAPTPSSTIVVPCDGRTYTAEVYGAGAPPAAGSPRPITESHVTAPFVMPVGCAGAAVTWRAGLPALPALDVPPIYVGLGAPFDTFTVRVASLAYPWSGEGWTLTHGGQAQPTAYAGPTATFAAPSTTAPLTFTGRFRLHRSVAVAEDAATPWELTVSAPATPIATAGLPMP